MRNLVSLAVASLLFLPALGARADGSVSGDDGSVPGDEARSGSPGGEVSPDGPERAKPTVVITFEALGTKPGPHDDFTVTFTWSEAVDGFRTGDIEIEGADKTSGLRGSDGAQVYTLEIETDEDLEGTIKVTVVEDAVSTTSTDDDDEDDTNDSHQHSELVDNKAPELEEATANVQKIVLVYHEEVDDNPDGDADENDYSVTTKVVDDDNTALSGVSPAEVYIEKDTVILTLAASDTVHPGDTVSLTYRHGSNPLEDKTGNQAPAFTDMAIENLRKITKPGPVRNLSAEVTDTTIKLDWDQPTDTGGVTILSYRIQARKDGGTYKTLEWAPAQDSANSEYLHDTLSAGETWTYLVAARNVAGEGDAVEIIKTTKPPKPTPPPEPHRQCGRSNGHRSGLGPAGRYRDQRDWRLQDRGGDQ